MTLLPCARVACTCLLCCAPAGCQLRSHLPLGVSRRGGGGGGGPGAARPRAPPARPPPPPATHNPWRIQPPHTPPALLSSLPPALSAGSIGKLRLQLVYTAAASATTAREGCITTEPWPAAALAPGAMGRCCLAPTAHCCASPASTLGRLAAAG
jgi:hypothetical protein